MEECLACTRSVRGGEGIDRWVGGWGSSPAGGFAVSPRDALCCEAVCLIAGPHPTPPLPTSLRQVVASAGGDGRGARHQRRD